MRRVRDFVIFVAPFLAIAALASVLVMATIVWWSILGQRNELQDQADRTEAVLTGIEELLLSDEENRATRAERLAAAVAEVDRLQSARHQALLTRIEELLDRPAGVQQEPVTAVPAE